MRRLFSVCLLAPLVYASPPPPAITPSSKPIPELLKRANNLCGSWIDVSSTTHPISCNPNVQCLIALTLTPQNIYCSDFRSPITSIFPYGHWPIDGCEAGQLCCPSTAPYVTRYNYDEQYTSAVQLVCGVGTATLIHAYAVPFTPQQTQAQTIGGVNTAAVSNPQPAITVSAVSNPQPAITASAVTVTQSPSPTTSSSPAPVATSSKASSGDGLAVGSEVGSIIGAICGAIALALTIFFGNKQLKKRREK